MNVLFPSFACFAPSRGNQDHDMAPALLGWSAVVGGHDEPVWLWGNVSREGTKEAKEQR
jgi:hypothetical protein